jgi:hypothetical protein
MPPNEQSRFFVFPPPAHLRRRQSSKGWNIMSLSNAPLPLERPRETPPRAFSIPRRLGAWRSRLGTRGLIVLSVAVIATAGAFN